MLKCEFHKIGFVWLTRKTNEREREREREREGERERDGFLIGLTSSNWTN